MHFFKNFGNHIGTAATTYVPRDVPKRYPPDFPMKKNRVGNKSNYNYLWDETKYYGHSNSFSRKGIYKKNYKQANK